MERFSFVPERCFGEQNVDDGPSWPSVLWIWSSSFFLKGPDQLFPNQLSFEALFWVGFWFLFDGGLNPFQTVSLVLFYLFTTVFLKLASYRCVGTATSSVPSQLRP